MEEDNEKAPDCPICFESLDNSTPRFLPCQSVICEKCIEDLIEDNILDCPECGSEHSAENGIKTFPESRKESSEAEVAAEKLKLEDNESCKVHGIEASIYCQEPSCQKTVLCIQKQEENVDPDQEPTKSEDEGFTTTKLDTEKQELKDQKTETEETDDKSEEEKKSPDVNVSKFNFEGKFAFEVNKITSEYYVAFLAYLV